MPPIPPRDAPSLRFHIRAARSSDVDSILQLIKDLAEYEKEPDAVKATPGLLRQNLFPTSTSTSDTAAAASPHVPEAPYAYCLLAIPGPPHDSYADTASSTAPDSEPLPVGMALYFYNFSTWNGKAGIYLEDLYVKPDCRGLGIGKALFAELGAIAEQKGLARIDWSVLKWNEPSIAFYEQTLGAKGMDEWRGMRLEGEGIKALSRLAVSSPKMQRKIAEL